MERRQIFKLGVASLFWWSQSPGKQIPVATAAKLPEDLTQSQIALQALLEGNQRFVQRQFKHPHLSSSRLHELSQAQHPFATLLCCADSRVPAELIFDQGLGDLFDVRIAGNTATDDVLASLEYAITVLETPLLMVLGHERCGAVTAAVNQNPLPGHMDRFVGAIAPAVKLARASVGAAAELSTLVDQAVTENVRYQVQQLQRSPLLQAKVTAGQLKIVGARYDLDTGVVTLVPS